MLLPDLRFVIAALRDVFSIFVGFNLLDSSFGLR